MISWLVWLGCTEPDCSTNEDVVGDGIDQNCDGRDGVDFDGDGQASRASGGIDCNDNDLSVLARLYYLDADQDSWGDEEQELWLCPEDVEMGLQNGMLAERYGDCDDERDFIHPNSIEVCDGFDNDCNGLVDQDDNNLDSLTTIRLYEDADLDGWGNIEKSQLYCELENGWVLNNRDCDDTDANNDCMNPDCHFGLCNTSFTFNDEQFDFALVPAGTGIIGSPSSEAAHEPEEGQVTIELSSDLYMLTTPVTMAMYEAMVSRTPSMFHNSPLCREQMDCPVETISFHEAALFANTMTTAFNQHIEEEQRDHCYACTEDNICEPIQTFTTCRGVRLPTETEWEYAARSGSEAPFWTILGDGHLNDSHISNDGCGRDWMLENGELLENYGWFCANNIGDLDDPFYGSKPVALRQPNGLGLFDMIGGIWEMTQDQYIDERPLSTTTTVPVDPYFPIYNPQLDAIVRKGGMWGDPPSDLRAARREPISLDYQNGDVGFRVVMRP